MCASSVGGFASRPWQEIGVVKEDTCILLEVPAFQSPSAGVLARFVRVGKGCLFSDPLIGQLLLQHFDDIYELDQLLILPLQLEFQHSNLFNKLSVVWL